jgi:hypothetical protein
MTQAPVGVPSLEAEVKAYIKEKYAKPAGVYLGIPHRLDRPASPSAKAPVAFVSWGCRIHHQVTLSEN